MAIMLMRWRLACVTQPAQRACRLYAFLLCCLFCRPAAEVILGRCTSCLMPENAPLGGVYWLWSGMLLRTWSTFLTGCSIRSLRYQWVCNCMPWMLVLSIGPLGSVHADGI